MPIEGFAHLDYDTLVWKHFIPEQYDFKIYDDGDDTFFTAINIDPLPLIEAMREINPISLLDFLDENGIGYVLKINTYIMSEYGITCSTRNISINIVLNDDGMVLYKLWK